jgi:hypothetical protein
MKSKFCLFGGMHFNNENSLHLYLKLLQFTGLKKDA